MVEVVAPTQSRRLPFWAMVVALVILALGGVFALLWFKLPTWAPAWVVEYSPWVDPIVRAVEFEGELEVTCSKLASRGGSVAPAMVGYLESDNPMTVNLACRVLREVTNPMMIKPVVEKLKRGTGLTVMDMSVLADALEKQPATQVMDQILPIPAQRDSTWMVLISLLGRLDDPRAVATLRDIIWGDPPEDFSGLHVFDSPAAYATRALSNSPVPQAREVIRQALTESVSHIRLCALAGLILPNGRGRLDDKGPLNDEIRQVLIDRLNDPVASVRDAAATFAGFNFLLGAEDILIAKLECADPSERSTLIFGLGGPHATDKAIQAISRYLRDRDQKIQRSAVDALGRMKNPVVVPIFLEALPVLSESAKIVLVNRMGDKALLASPDAVPLLFLLLEASDFDLAKSAERALLNIELDEERQARFESLRERLYRPAE